MLKSIKILGNEIYKYYESSIIRLMFIGSIKSLKLYNSNEIDSLEKWDSEIFLLKESFHLFFKEKNCNHNDYSFEEYLEYANNKFN